MLAVLLRIYGYDFQNYSKALVRRRVTQHMHLENLASLEELRHKVTHHREAAAALVKTLSINVSEMFRDPEFFLALRRQAIPLLRDNEHLKIWHAGCAGGEEVYAMAILFMEEGLYERSRLYGTDFNNLILDKAKRGIFPLDKMQENVRNYHASGGTEPFVNYYHAQYDGAAMRSVLKKNMVYAHHDLATDSVFGEMQMVVCRNVLIYFDRELQRRVFQLFYDSLSVGGLLCLGSQESLDGNGLTDRFEAVAADQKIYRKLA